MLTTNVVSASLLQKETSLRRHRRRRQSGFMCPWGCVVDRLVFGGFLDLLSCKYLSCEFFFFLNCVEVQT